MKLCRSIPIIILFVYLLSFGVSALDETEAYEKVERASGARGLFDAAPSDARKVLEDAGIDDVDFYTVYEASPRKIVAALLDTVRGALGAPLRALARAMCVVLLTAAATCFTGGDEKLCAAVNLVGGCVCVLASAAPLSALAGAAVSAIRASADFSLALIPVLTVVTASGGSPFWASAYSASVTAAAQGLSRLNSGVITPIAGITAATGVTDSLFPGINLSRFGDLVKKSALWIFTGAAGLFSAFLTLRGVMASSADTLAAKGARLAVTTFIPIIGPAMSEAYSAVAGSLSMIKSAAGVFGIVVLVVVNAPIIIELVLWKVTLVLASTAAAMLGQRAQSDILNALSGAVTILTACVVFAAFLLIISTAAMLTVGNKNV